MAETSSVAVEQIPQPAAAESPEDGPPDIWDLCSTSADLLSDPSLPPEPSSRRGKRALPGTRKGVRFTCTAPGCTKSYPKPAQLTYHIDTVHLNLKWFTCIYKHCSRSFYHPSQMKRHLRTHGPAQHQCDLCYKSFSTASNLRAHQRKCRLLLVCSVCGETFLTGAEIQAHRQSHCVYLKCLYKDCYEHLAVEHFRGHIALHKDALKCPLCSHMYVLQENLEVHMRQDHGTEVVTSPPECVDDKDVRGWLRAMMGAGGEEEDGGEEERRREQGGGGAEVVVASTVEKPEDLKKMYRCAEPGCGYSTATPRWLTKHRLKHSRTHECKECGKVMSDRWSLTLHLATHEGAQQFPCQYCSKSFPSQSRLSQHCQSYHPESRVWSCEECGLGFSTNKRLLLHYRKHVTSGLEG